jgi:thioredoxin
MNKNAMRTALGILFLLSGMMLYAQTEKKPEFLTKETFKQKVWDFEKNPTEFTYVGDKPCMIDFTADWCGWCKKIAPFLDEFCNTYQNEIYVYKINIDKEKELRDMFQARSIPVVVFFPMQGQPTATKGALPKEQYQQMIETVLLGKAATKSE